MRFYMNSLYKKIIIAYIPIFIVSMVVVQILYMISEQIFEKQVSDTIDVQINNTVSIIENELLRVNYIQASFFQNNDVQMLAYYGDTLENNERLQLINNIVNKIEDTSLNTSYIENMCLFINDGDEIQVIDIRGIFDYDSNDFIDVYNESSTRKIVIKNNKIYLRLDNQDSTNGNTNISVIAQLSRMQFEKQLGIIKDYEDCAVSMITDNSDYMILQGGINDISSQQIKEFVNSGMSKVTINNREYLFNSTYSTQTGVYINKLVPVDNLNGLLVPVKIVTVIFMVIGLLIIVFFYMISKRMIKKPLEQMLESFGYVEKGDFDHKIYHDSSDEFSDIFAYYNNMLDNLKQTIKQMNEYVALKKEAEMKQLQTQIEPHFLFNSFYIQRRILKMGDYETLEKFINHLGKYFEYLHNNSVEMISLIEEYNHAYNYLEIQKMRFSNRLSIEMSGPDSRISHVLVPRLIIQPLVENAFEYGLEDLEENAVLKLYFEYDEEFLYIVVEDNGKSANEEMIEKLNRKIQEDTSGISALININKRLKYKFGESSGVIMEYIDGGGVRAIEKIKIGKID